MEYMIPETPKKPAVENAKVKSTPQNRGTASKGEYLTSVRVDDISPSVLHDLKNFDICEFEDMLLYFLTRCLVDETTQTISMNQCLQEVLPICAKIRDDLVIYCHTEKENARYKPFVSACNYALQKLKGISSLPLRPETSEEARQILFHQSDPTIINGLHNGRKSSRKPDVVIVSLGAAARGNETKEDGLDTSPRWDDFALKTGLDKPEEPFSWDDILSCQEFKVKSKKGPLPDPPVKYTLEHVELVEPQVAPFDSSGELIYDSDPEFDSELDPEIESSTAEVISAGPDLRRSARVANSPGSRPTVTQGSVSGGASKKMSGSGSAAKKASESRRAGKKSSLGHAASGSSLLDITSALGPAAGSASSLTVTPAPEKSNLKRSSDNKQGSIKKAKSTRTPPAMVQSALYAAEMLSKNCYISHVINLTIVDDVAHVWWYDKQGVIQSQGINFIKHLPHFLVLLLAFQRFSLQDWGVIPEFSDSPFIDPKLPPSPKRIFTFPRGAKVVIDTSKKIYGGYGLVGRCTQMLEAYIWPESEAENVEMVMKVSWPEISRRSEPEIIQAAMDLAKGDTDVTNHLPDLICFHELGQYSTAKIRKALKIKETGSRTCRIMIFRKLYPIIELGYQGFWTAFWHCMRCHYKLWVLGVEHRDISEHNLMYDIKDGFIYGVLIDYDLARLRSSPTRTPDTRGTERTGTMPFMALDLLTEAGWAGEVEHLYRHDNESFIWVLLWIICHYEDGKEIRQPPFYVWLGADHIYCHAKKSTFGAFMPVPVTPTYRLYQNPTEELLLVLERRVLIQHEYQRSITQSLSMATRSDLFSVAQEVGVVNKQWSRPIPAVTPIPYHLTVEPSMTKLMDEFTDAVLRGSGTLPFEPWWLSSME